MEAVWRDAIWQNRHFWDSYVADSINPLLGIALILFCLTAKPPQTARIYLLKSGLALLLIYVVAHLNKWLHLWPSHRNFPSGHTVFAVSVAVALALWNRKTLVVTAPLLLFYGWLMVALRFHDWLDIFGGVALSWPLSWLILHKTARDVREFHQKSMRESATPHAPIPSVSRD